MNRSVLAICAIIALSPCVVAQLSVYGSLALGSETNALYNYQKQPDQIRQAYFQGMYVSARSMNRFDVMYVGGLSMYGTLQERNYLDHSIRARYLTAYASPGITQRRAGAAESAENADETDDGPSFEMMEDFGRRYLELSVKPGARHNKAMFQDFNTTGLEIAGNYYTDLSASVRGCGGGAVTFRSYPNVPELSNITWNVRGLLQSDTRERWQYGVELQAGIKQYTQGQADTSVYESRGSSGRGKGGSGGSSGSGNSVKKRVLLSASSRATSQIFGRVFGEVRWPESAFHGELGGRWNPSNSARRIGQDASGSLLTDDLYNEYYSYEGVEGMMRYTHSLFWGVQSVVALQVEQKVFGSSALDLLGTELAPERRDLRTSFEIQFTRALSITETMSLDLSLSGAIVRNESNDAYNDFSASGVTLSVGMGF